MAAVEEGMEDILLVDACMFTQALYPHLYLGMSRSDRMDGAVHGQELQRCQEMELGRRRSSMQGASWGSATNARSLLDEARKVEILIARAN